MTNYMASFIRGYADIVVPLHNLTHKNVEFKWKDVHREALERLKCGVRGKNYVF